MLQPTKRGERMRTLLTPPEIAAAYGVNLDKVMDWIDSGELRAINVAADAKSKNARYRVYPADLAAFENARSAAPAPLTPPELPPQPEPPPPRKRGRPRKQVGEYARY